LIHSNVTASVRQVNGFVLLLINLLKQTCCVGIWLRC